MTDQVFLPSRPKVHKNRDSWTVCLKTARQEVTRRGLMIQKREASGVGVVGDVRDTEGGSIWL